MTGGPATDVPRADRAAHRQGVFSATLTELLVMLFFVLLLLSVREMSTLAKELAGARDEAAMAQRTAADVSKKLLGLEEEHSKLVAENAGLVRLLHRRPEANEDFVRLVRDTAARATRVEEEVEVLRGDASALRAELARERATRENLERASPSAKDAAETIASLTGKVTAAQKRAQELKDQLTFLQRSVGHGGIDFPPCWIDPETKRVQYILRVIIREDAIGFEPAWPASRQLQADEVPSVKELVSLGQVNVGEFETIASPLMRWYPTQDPECRHYVWIRDVAHSKSAFKQALLTVEGAFYKYLER